MKNLFGVLEYNVIEDKKIYENWNLLNENLILELNEESLIKYFNKIYLYNFHKYPKIISDNIVPKYVVKYTENYDLMNNKNYNIFFNKYKNYLDIKKFKGMFIFKKNKEKYIKNIICFKFKDNDYIDKLIEEVNDDFFKTMKPLRDTTKLASFLYNKEITNNYISEYNSKNMTFYNIDTAETNMFIEPFLMLKDNIGNDSYYDLLFKDKIFTIQNLISYKY